VLQEVKVPMSTVEFSLINTEPLTFKVDGMRDGEGSMPAFLEKDMVLTLVSGKWPLVDYHDCDVHTFVFQKADGSQFSMLLSGFTYDCAFSKEIQQKHIEEEGRYIGITVKELTKAGQHSPE
jgi:hypothetical protein